MKPHLSVLVTLNYPGHMIEPKLYWWQATALTTRLNLFSHLCKISFCPPSPDAIYISEIVKKLGQCKELIGWPNNLIDEWAESV